ncbi:MAG: AAA family ATPase [Chloroflexia bacterium]
MARRIDKILNEITTRYLESSDFNGVPLRWLARVLRFRWSNFVREVEILLQTGKVLILFSSTDVNTHILRLGSESLEIQISKLPTADEHACIYPTPSHLEAVVDRANYEGRPYTLSLALGAPQLRFRSFDLSVLEFYRNDPRYDYVTDEVRGRIYITTEYYEAKNVKKSDRIFLSTFGFCYDEDLNRAVAVYLRYLADLSPEHQQIWKAKELEGDYKLHPDYYDNTIRGNWGTGISIFEAFMKELHIINQMAQAMERPPLFRSDFSDRDKPLEFSFLVRPTLREYNDFVLLLDKLLSENINKEFFMNEVSDEYDEPRSDGKIVIRNKGTITLLDEWIRAYFQTPDWEPINNMLETLRDVRKQRQQPAHKINENTFDQQFIHRQRELMIRAYAAVETLRSMFAFHPKCQSIEIDQLLLKGKIWPY